MTDYDWFVKRGLVRFEIWKIVYSGWDGVGSKRYRKSGKVVRFWSRKKAQHLADILNAKEG